MSHCPLCERPFTFPGAYLASADYAGQWFTFPICLACRLRQARLPKQARQRQDVTAANKVIKRPDRYEVSVWPNRDEAKIYARLSADAIGRAGEPQAMARSNAATSTLAPSLAASR